MIKTLKGKIYTGIAIDPERRFLEHFSKNGKGAKFFYSDTPSDIIYFELYLNRSDATKREIQIKKMSRKKKDELASAF